MKICKAPRGTIVKLVPKREGTDGWTVDRSIDRYTYKFSRVECGPWRICRNKPSSNFYRWCWMDGLGACKPAKHHHPVSILTVVEKKRCICSFILSESPEWLTLNYAHFLKRRRPSLLPVPSRPIHHVLCSQLTFYRYDWGSDTAVSPSQSSQSI